MHNEKINVNKFIFSRVWKCLKKVCLSNLLMYETAYLICEVA